MSPTAATSSDAARLAAAREFAEAVVRPAARDWDRAGAGVQAVMQECIAAGIVTPTLRIAGEAQDLAGALRVLEALAWGCAGFAYAVHAAGLAARLLETVGTPEQAAQLMPLLTAGPGTLRMGAIAVSEPGAGSDVAAISTIARHDGDAYVLNGRKTFITNALDASAIIVYATTDRRLGWAGLAPFVVPRDTPGLQVTPTARPLGLRAGRYGDLSLEDCRIPAAHRLGDPDSGQDLQRLRPLDMSRPAAAAIAVGLAQAAFEYGRDYVQRREQFGRPLATQQAIAFRLADMATDIEAARLLTDDAGRLADAGAKEAHVRSSMAKCFATEVAMATTTAAVQLLGGTGCTEAHPVEKWMRDAKLLEICEGPSEVQRLVISRAILHA